LNPAAVARSARIAFGRRGLATNLITKGLPAAMSDWKQKIYVL
jgi:hypothetical protein